MAPHPLPPPVVPPEDEDDEDDDVGAVGEALLLLPPHAASRNTEAQVSAAKAARRLDGAFICQRAFLSVPAKAGGGSTVTVRAQAVVGC